MKSPSKQEWWESLTKAEKAIYSQPGSFFRLSIIYIPRYQNNLFAARAAHTAIYGVRGIVPYARTYEAGKVRVEMFRKLREYARLRDCGAEREAALSILELGLQGEVYE